MKAIAQLLSVAMLASVSVNASGEMKIIRHRFDQQKAILFQLAKRCEIRAHQLHMRIDKHDCARFMGTRAMRLHMMKMKFDFNREFDKHYLVDIGQGETQVSRDTYAHDMELFRQADAESMQKLDEWLGTQEVIQNDYNNDDENDGDYCAPGACDDATGAAN